MKDMITRQTVESGIYGLAVGDAVGVPYEFRRREEIVPPCTDMVGYGTYGLPAGTWSDDTSMTVATLDGLCGNDLTAVMNNFAEWLDDGKFSADGTFDVGRTCRRAISNFKAGASVAECGCAGEFDNGNGSLMRIMPASLYAIAAANGDKYDADFIERVSSLTHAHAVSKAACRIYTDIVQSIVRKKNKKRIFPIKEIYGQEVFARLATRKFYSVSADEIRSSGYVVDTLEATVWCFWTTASYRDCVLKAVNLGGDTDTVASVAGGIAGLYYGLQSIPSEWLETLRSKDVINAAIDKFCTCLNLCSAD